MLERKGNGQGLTRPEVATLLAYSKLILKEKILDIDFSKAPEFNYYLEKEFPDILLKKFSKYLPQHRLSREIISTQLSNDFITNLGITFVQEVQTETNAKIEEIIYAYVIAKDVLRSKFMLEKVEKLDFIVPAETQKQMILAINNLLHKGVYWFLYYLSRKAGGEDARQSIHNALSKFGDKMNLIYDGLKFLLEGDEKNQWSDAVNKLVDENVDEALAYYIASANYFYSALNIAAVETHSQKEFLQLAKVHYLLRAQLDISSLEKMITATPISDHWLCHAVHLLLNEIEKKQIILASSIMKYMKDCKTESACLNKWLEQEQAFCQKWKSLIEQMKQPNVIKVDILYILSKELTNVME
jgi:glutamate dehydrogenase